MNPTRLPQPDPVTSFFSGIVVVVVEMVAVAGDHDSDRAASPRLIRVPFEAFGFLDNVGGLSRINFQCGLTLCPAGGADCDPPDPVTSFFPWGTSGRGGGGGGGGDGGRKSGQFPVWSNTNPHRWRRL